MQTSSSKVVQRALFKRTQGNKRCLCTSPARRQVQHHDIVVLGGGPAGLCLTAALCATPSIASTQKITLLEGSSLDSIRQWSPPSRQSASNRVSSITRENVGYLRHKRIWEHVDESRIRGIREMQVWDGVSGSRIDFFGQQDTTDPLAPLQPMSYMTENRNLQRAALRSMDETRADLDVLDSHRVIKLERDENGWPIAHLVNASGYETTIRARLLIGADGFSSPVKSFSNIDSFGWAYNKQGVVATMHVEPSPTIEEAMQTAWQRFLPEGPVAFLPLTESIASLVWSTTPAIAAGLKRVPTELLPSLIGAAFALPYRSLERLYPLIVSEQTTADDLSAAVNAAFAAEAEKWSVDRVQAPVPPIVKSIEPGSVASFPLRLSHADSYLGEPTNGHDIRTALLGDAAHTIHPLAGQGLNMGLGDVQSLVSTLSTISERGGDVGSYDSLRPYARQRYWANHKILSACDHLASLYSSKSGPIVALRSQGLNLVNSIDPLKKIFMDNAGANEWQTEGKRRKGAWERVADAIDGAGQAVQLAKTAGSLGASILRQRFSRGDTRHDRPL